MANILLNTRKEIESLGFNIIGYDFNRPWGGFLLIDESQSKEFIYKFISKEDLKIKINFSCAHCRPTKWSQFKSESMQKFQ